MCIRNWGNCVLYCREWDSRAQWGLREIHGMGSYRRLDRAGRYPRYFCCGYEERTMNHVIVMSVS